MRIYWFGGPRGFFEAPVPAHDFTRRLSRPRRKPLGGLASKKRAHWGERIRCEGRGSVTFACDFHVGNDVVMTGDGTIEFAPAASIDRFSEIRNCSRFLSGIRLRVEPFCYIDATHGVRIGDNVKLGSGTKLLAFDRIREFRTPNAVVPRATRGITIGSNVVIGPNVVVHDGVFIGSNAVIAAGAVITRNVAPNSVVGLRRAYASRENVFGLS